MERQPIIKTEVVASTDPHHRSRRPALFTLALSMALSTTLPGLAKADNSEDIFIPDHLLYYNPLKNSDDIDRTSVSTSAVILDNKSLEQAAMQLRDSGMNATQRALNYQWMRQYHQQSEVEYGSKVLSKLFKMGLRTYWDKLQKTSTLAGKVSAAGSTGGGRQSGNSGGSFDFSDDIDYDLKISGNKLKLSMDYKF